jgi:hypothetical protein
MNPKIGQLKALFCSLLILIIGNVRAQSISGNGGSIPDNGNVVVLPIEDGGVNPLSMETVLRDTFARANAGYINMSEIKVDAQQGNTFQFTQSNLPLVLINTYGQEILDDPKIAAGFKLIDNGYGGPNHINDNPAYTGFIGIEIRGSSSQMFPKKNYGFETWDAFSNEIDTSLLGMPAENDWILNASYTDKTLLRNTLGYQIWMNMGYYATRYRYVEVFINNTYKGVYVFSEKIKRDKDRVDIAKMNNTMNTGDKLTGGYIFKIDRGEGWTSSFPSPNNPSLSIYFQYEYPKYDDITDQQKQYLQAYVNWFEMALDAPNFADPVVGWRKYAVEETFVDYFIQNEFCKNVDGYRLSTFIQKERDSEGGKLRMGPVWDFDLAWHNADYCEGDLYTGWAYQFPCVEDYFQLPFWWERLLQDTVFANNVQCKWKLLRDTYLSKARVFEYIDTTAALLEQAQQRNFQTWPILGTYVWPNPWPYPTTYAGEIASIKSWISYRLAWLDQNMPGNCDSYGLPEFRSLLSVQPNPTSGFVSIKGLKPSEHILECCLFDITGNEVAKIGIGSTTFNIDWLAKGIYLLKLKTNSQEQFVKLVKD